MTCPFELHLTVRHSGEPTFIDNFRTACAELNVKPLIVGLGKAGQDVMTSSRFDGHYVSALIHSRVLTEQLQRRGLTVIRTKIETAPWHEQAENPNSNQYFESHLAVRVYGDDEEQALRSFSLEHGCHTSHNAFKVYPNYKVIMVTKRDAKTTAANFIAKVDAIRKALTDSDFKVDKPIVEFVIHDTNQAHDDDWIADLDFSHDH